MIQIGIHSYKSLLIYELREEKKNDGGAVNSCLVWTIFTI